VRFLDVASGMIKHRPQITVDIRSFDPISSIDTCAICNVFSSKRLLGAAIARGASFLVAGYVRYELVVRRRTDPTVGELAIQQEAAAALRSATVLTELPVSIADLQAVAGRPEARKMGKGEIAAMAMALRMRKAFTTDDQGARRAATTIGVHLSQTIPQMLGWLVYLGELTDGDIQTVLTQHEERVREGKGRLTPYFRAMYEEACRYRMLQNGLPPSAPDSGGRGAAA
jgi:hypothetical protein